MIPPTVPPPDRGARRLETRQVADDPRYEDVADDVEKGRQWQDQRIGQRCQVTGRDVCADEQGEENPEEGNDVGRERRAATEARQCVGTTRDEHDQDEKSELGPAATTAEGGR